MVPSLCDSHGRLHSPFPGLDTRGCPARECPHVRARGDLCLLPGDFSGRAEELYEDSGVEAEDLSGSGAGWGPAAGAGG